MRYQKPSSPRSALISNPEEEPEPTELRIWSDLSDCPPWRCCAGCLVARVFRRLSAERTVSMEPGELKLSVVGAMLWNVGPNLLGVLQNHVSDPPTVTFYFDGDLTPEESGECRGYAHVDPCRPRVGRNGGGRRSCERPRAAVEPARNLGLRAPTMTAFGGHRPPSQTAKLSALLEAASLENATVQPFASPVAPATVGGRLQFRFPRFSESANRSAASGRRTCRNPAAASMRETSGYSNRSVVDPACPNHGRSLTAPSSSVRVSRVIMATSSGVYWLLWQARASAAFRASASE